MDYLCELPNDAARRRALDSLPPDLNSTYERILNRVNQTNGETQKLVRRSLRLIANVNLNADGSDGFSSEALCEAVSIDFGMTKLDPQAISDEHEILRWCSSLVRKSADGRNLELAHFTVTEFLEQIDPKRDLSIGAYRIDPVTDKIILAKLCLTYLNLEDFDRISPYSRQTVQGRFEKFPFREYAVHNWQYIAQNYGGDAELFRLVQKLLSPSKPSTFVTWMQDVILASGITEKLMAEQLIADKEGHNIIDSVIAETTALHWAAFYMLAEVCTWLTESGCDVNRNSAVGTPLQCALFDWNYLFTTPLDSGTFSVFSRHERITMPVFNSLLDAGANPNCWFDFGTEKVSFVRTALLYGNPGLVMRLLDMGVILDSRCLDVLERHLESEDCCKVLNSTRAHNVWPQDCGRLVQLALKAKTRNATSLMSQGMDLPHPKEFYEQALRTTAELGQVEVARGLLQDQNLDVDAADESTGRTALHHAVRTDQLEVAEILMDHGADSSRTDNQEKTALHHSAQAKSFSCLKFFLHLGADTTVRDLEGMTVWHLAAQEGNIQALTILLSGPVDPTSALDIKARDGKTPLLCASGSGSKEPVRLLLNAGSSLSETALDGSSSFHSAVRSGSLEVVEFLIEQRIDLSTLTRDGSNAIHCAVGSSSGETAEIVRILLEKGVDPHKARGNGSTPLQDLVGNIKRRSLSSDELGYLVAAGRTLLESLLARSRLASDMELGSELLYLACLKEKDFPHADEAVTAFLELGLDCNIRFNDGQTALIAAAGKGNLAILNTLLRNGADPCINASGLNALHCACSNDHKDIIVRLRETGIDWNSRATATVCGAERNNVTVVHVAAKIPNNQILEYLLDEELVSDINARMNCGETPLSVAVCARASRNVSLLLANGADSTVLDNFGNSAIHYAARLGDRDVIADFMKYGSDLGLSNSFGLTPELQAIRYDHKALANTIRNYVHDQGGCRNYKPILWCGLSNFMFP